METLLALAERVEVGDEELAKLVLHLARDEPVVDLGAHGGKVVRRRLGAAARCRRGVGRRQVDGPEVLGERDGERGDERERLLVRRELLRVGRLAVAPLTQGRKETRSTHKVLERGPRPLARHALALALPDNADRLELADDAQDAALLDDAGVVLLLLDVAVRGGRGCGLEALKEERDERRGEEVGEALVQSRDDLQGGGSASASGEG